MLNSIKTFKRYCEVTLNVFFHKTIFLMMKKNLVYKIDFLCQIKISILNILKIPGFLFKIRVFFSKFRFFWPKLSNSGKLATLLLTK